MLVDDRDRADPVVLDHLDEELEGRERARDVDLGRHHALDRAVLRQGHHLPGLSAINTGRLVARSRSCVTEPRNMLARSPMRDEPMTITSAPQPAAASATTSATWPDPAVIASVGMPAAPSSSIALFSVSPISSSASTYAKPWGTKIACATCRTRTFEPGAAAAAIAALVAGMTSSPPATARRTLHASRTSGDGLPRTTSSGQSSAVIS